MSSKWVKTQAQVVIRDLQPWLDQLYTEHRVRLELCVSLPTSLDGIPPGVTMEAYRVDGVGKRSALHNDWKTVQPTCGGCIESAALHMASLLLLSLDNDKALAEKQASLWD